MTNFLMERSYRTRLNARESNLDRERHELSVCPLSVGARVGRPRPWEVTVTRVNMVKSGKYGA